MTTTSVSSAPPPEPARTDDHRAGSTTGTTRSVRLWRRWVRAAAAAQRCGVPF